MNEMNGADEKRRHPLLAKDEAEILQGLFVQALIPVAIIVVISSIVLFFGLQFLMQKASFGNYGLAPGAVLASVSRFISTYIVIALINVLLMVSLSVIVLYLVLHRIVLPLMRITRDLKKIAESGERKPVTVRKTDRLLIPLVEAINRIIA